MPPKTESQEKIGFSIWLIPSKNPYEELQSIITKFSAKLDAPPFYPHVTIFCGSTYSLHDIQNMLEPLLSQTNPLRLQINNIEVTDQLFKSLFLTFKNNSTLTNLFSKIAENTSNDDNYQLFPHLSLLYKKMPLNQKKQLIKEVAFLAPEITFDKIQIIYEANPDEVSSWQAVYEYDLAKQQRIVDKIPPK